MAKGKKKEEAAPAPEPEGAETPEESGGQGLPPNVAGALCYVLGHVTGLLFLAIEREDETVRFHAAQSVVTSLGVWFLYAATQWVPVVGDLLETFIRPIAIAAIIFLCYKAFVGERFKVPFFGTLAERLLETGVLDCCRRAEEK